MGKKLIKHMLVVGGFLIALGVIDWIIYKVTGDPLLSVGGYGGDCKISTGLWLQITTTYPLCEIGEEATFVKVSFEPMYGLTAFVVLTALSMIPIKRKSKQKC